jgi:hypothetical protein
VLRSRSIFVQCRNGNKFKFIYRYVNFPAHKYRTSKSKAIYKQKFPVTKILVQNFTQRGGGANPDPFFFFKVRKLAQCPNHLDPLQYKSNTKKKYGPQLI